MVESKEVWKINELPGMVGYVYFQHSGGWIWGKRKLQSETVSKIKRKKLKMNKQKKHELKLKMNIKQEINKTESKV